MTQSDDNAPPLGPEDAAEATAAASMDPTEGDLAELFRQLIEERIPFNRHLGLKLGRIDRALQEAELSLELKEEHIGNVVRGMPHGGLLAALIDAASGAAAALTLTDLRQAPTVATVDMRVDFLRPAKGSTLRAVATVMRSGRSVVVVRTDVFDDDGALVALGTSTFTASRTVRKLAQHARTGEP